MQGVGSPARVVAASTSREGGGGGGVAVAPASALPMDAECTCVHSGAPTCPAAQWIASAFPRCVRWCTGAPPAARCCVHRAVEGSGRALPPAVAMVPRPWLAASGMAAASLAARRSRCRITLLCRHMRSWCHRAARRCVAEGPSRRAVPCRDLPCRAVFVRADSLRVRARWCRRTT
jgi:hypothetical protein